MVDFHFHELLLDLFLEYAFWGIPAVIGLGVLRHLLLPRLRGAAGEAKVGRVLGSLFDQVVNDVIVPDGRGGLTQIDHVALTAEGLLVIETKNYSGAIFGREGDAQWTQRLGGRSYRFQNPLRQNHLHISALRALQLGAPVQGRVVFTDDATFPIGVPEGVSHLSGLRRDLGGAVVGTEGRLRYGDAWEQLKRAVRTDAPARKEHLRALRERQGRDLRPRTAVVLLVLLSVWLGVAWLRYQSPTAQPPALVGPAPSAPAVAPVASPPFTGRDIKPVWAQPQRSSSASLVAEITWAKSTDSRTEECNLATAAVLIDNSVDNRKRRDRSCGDARPAEHPASESSGEPAPGGRLACWRIGCKGRDSHRLVDRVPH